MSAGSTVASEYVLGHSEHELDRLIHQSRFFGELSETLLRQAGLAPGMRVLDAGCGVGDVSFLAARIVGEAGSVVGVDRSVEAIVKARSRVPAAVANIDFVAADLATFVAEEPVDALIGRLVMMYWPEPAAMLRRLVRQVKPGGLVAMLELDLEACKTEPRCLLFDRIMDWTRQAFAAGGADTRMALKMGRVFEDAGLPTPTVRAISRLDRGPDSETYAVVAGLTRTLLPAIERFGIATAEEIDVDSLEARLREEAVARRATQAAPPMAAAWCRVP
jgi:SAM-dependent methyltransferase